MDTQENIGRILGGVAGPPADKIPTPTDTEAQREIAVRSARVLLRTIGSPEAARKVVRGTIAYYGDGSGELGRVLDALNWQYGPIWPEATAS